MLASKESAAGKKEQGLLEKNSISENTIKRCKTYKIFGIRRPLRVFPQKVNIHMQDDNILLNFTLPSGSYASILIEQLQKTVGVHMS